MCLHTHTWINYSDIKYIYTVYKTPISMTDNNTKLLFQDYNSQKLHHVQWFESDCVFHIEGVHLFHAMWELSTVSKKVKHSKNFFQILQRGLRFFSLWAVLHNFSKHFLEHGWSRNFELGGRQTQNVSSTLIVFLGNLVIIEKFCLF